MVYFVYTYNIITCKQYCGYMFESAVVSIQTKALSQESEKPLPGRQVHVMGLQWDL